MAKYADLLPIPNLTPSDLCRFFNMVEKVNTCWNWMGMNKTGYGYFKINKINYIASRISYKIHFIDPGLLYVLHECDNPACVNPQHLYLGDQKINVKDAFDRGRIRHDEDYHPQAKLNSDDIPEIFELRSNGKTRKQIANIKGVSEAAIKDVLYGRSWKNVSKR